MFAPSRFLRNFSSISPEVVTRIANKAMAAPNAFPAAKPIPFGLRAKDGSYVPVKDFQDYIKIVSEHPDFKDKVFAGAGMKHIDTKRFNSLTLRYVAVAFALSIAGALAYKIHNNAYMRDVRAGKCIVSSSIETIMCCHYSWF